VVTDVHKVLSRIEDFTKKIHSNEIKGFSGKSLKNYVVIGIGGSYLSIEFVYEAIRSSRPSAAKDGKLKFVANVDPVDFKRAVEGLNAEETLFIINSKTFTTAETMLNAATCRNWLLS
jgi:glucose-6-phosphate isomerase